MTPTAHATRFLIWASADTSLQSGSALETFINATDGLGASATVSALTNVR